MIRKTFFIFLSILVMAVPSFSLAETLAAGDFTFVAIPDAQSLVQDHPEAWATMTKWIADNKTNLNIQAVIGLGDITEIHNAGQFRVAAAGYDVIDNAGIPFMPVIGNHDYQDSVHRQATLYNDFFGPERFSNKPWYGGNYNGSDENFYEKINVGGQKFLIMALEYFPRTEVLNWAEQIISANQDRDVILATHAYLNNAGNRQPTADVFGPNDVKSADTSNSGQDLWDKLIKKNSNIKLVISGHFVGMPRTNHRTDNSNSGTPVNQLFANYQYLNAEEGSYMPVIKFSPSKKEINVSFYSPITLANDPANKSFNFTYNLQEPDLTNPVCGAPDLSKSSVPDYCAIGSVSKISVVNGKYSWSCTGSNSVAKRCLSPKYILSRFSLPKAELASVAEVHVDAGKPVCVSGAAVNLTTVDQKYPVRWFLDNKIARVGTTPNLPGAGTWAWGGDLYICFSNLTSGLHVARAEINPGKSFARSSETKITVGDTDSNQGVLAITAPVANASWSKGSNQVITWSKTGTMAQTAQLTIAHNGQAISGYSNKAIPNTGSYNLTVPSDWPIGGGYQIWLGAYTSDTVNPSASSNIFSVTAAQQDQTAAINVLPLSSSYNVNSPLNLRWATSGTLTDNRVLIIWNRVDPITGGSSGTGWIAQNPINNTGNYNWTIPTELANGGTYKIQIFNYDQSSGGNYAGSIIGNSNTFTLVKAGDANKYVLAFSSPTANTTTAAGQPLPVSWTNVGALAPTVAPLGFLYLYTAAGTMVANPYQDYINRGLSINGWSVKIPSDSLSPTLRSDLVGGVKYQFVLKDGLGTEIGRSPFFYVAGKTPAPGSATIAVGSVASSYQTGQIIPISWTINGNLTDNRVIIIWTKIDTSTGGSLGTGWIAQNPISTPLNWTIPSDLTDGTYRIQIFNYDPASNSNPGAVGTYAGSVVGNSANFSVTKASTLTSSPAPLSCKLGQTLVNGQCISSTPTPTPVPSDLTISRLFSSTSTNIAYLSKGLAFSAGLVNTGSTAISNVKVRWIIDGATAKEGVIPSVPANSTIWGDQSNGLTDYYNKYALGSHVIQFVVDPDNSISENNETNNSAQLNFTVVTDPVTALNTAAINGLANILQGIQQLLNGLR